MVKDKNKKVFYYDDELCDDFAGLNIKRCTVDKNFRYLRDKVYNFMLEKSKHSNYEVVKYIRREKERI
jgi:hypothetical protein